MHTPILTHMHNSDIDECSRRSHNCEQSCTNTEGRFNCSCRDGFLLQNDMRSCQGRAYTSGGITHIPILLHSFFPIAVDPNRNCSADNICEQLCVREANISTSVTTEVCSCRNGYTLDENRRSCSGR